MTNPNTTPENAEDFANIPITQITLEGFENSRSGDYTKASVSDEKTGQGQTFEEFKNSIATQGQLVPVVVRPKGRKFQLIAGFRRYHALKQLAEEGENLANATIKANIKLKLSDFEARTINVFENTGRDDMTAADLAFGIQDMRNQALGQGVTLTNEAIARSIGKVQGYVNRLVNITSKGNPKVLANWRASAIQLPVSKMLEIANLAKEEQEDAYKKTLKGFSKKSKRGPGAWVDTAEKKAYKLGHIIAQLEKDPSHMNNEEYSPVTIELLHDLGYISFGTSADKDKGPSVKQLNKIAAAMNDGYNAPREVADPEEPKNPKGRKSKPKGTATVANGASTTLPA